MLIRKLFRTAWKYKAQFISMILMVMIGVGVFVGFNMEWYSLQKNTSAFFSDTKFADYRVYGEGMFSESDAEAFGNYDGIAAASRVLSVNTVITDVNGTPSDGKKSLALFVVENYSLSHLVKTSGEDYDEDIEGFWLSDKFAAANGISLHDTVTVKYSDYAVSGEVVGLAKSSEFMICVADSSQLMPDYNTYGFVYASPKTVASQLGAVPYYQINLLSDLEKEEVEQIATQVLGKTTLVLSKDEDYSYAGAQSEIEEGQTMGAILPVLFLLIGILTMITTMHRITANEKTQIGTLKALGFKDSKILWHYTSYGLVIGFIGAVLGIGLGFGIAALVVGPNGMQSTYMDLPSWGLHVPWFCWLAVAATIALLTLICFLSVKKMLKGTAADALRPYTPKKIKAMVIEKTGLWNKLSFATKWNLRDVLRHKSRSLMTLLGIIGCMVLLVGGLGMQDTMTGFIDLIDNQLYNYETRVNIVSSADNSEVARFAQDYDGDWVASSSVKLNGEAVALEIYDVMHDKIRFVDEGNKRVTLSDDGVYICIRLSETIKTGQYIEFSPYGGDSVYNVRVAGVLRSVMTENIVMTRAYAEECGIPYQISAVFTDSAVPDDTYSFISDKQSKQAIMDSYDTFMEIMYLMVLIFILAAVVLGVVVLYNLGVMSYVERYRELATLKVVGFKDKRIGRILISQNIWLTVIGVLIGLPTGVGVLKLLLDMLGREYELKLVLGALTYCVSILVTFGVSLVVSIFVARKNRKIDMVEALKGAE